MRIAQISDTHIVVPETDHPAGARRPGNLARCVADINIQQPDVVILTGDTVQYGRPEEYARLRTLLSPLTAPLYLIPGNRDNRETMRAAFRDSTFLPQQGDFLHYAVEDHEVRLVGLDSTSPGERKGFFCSDRQAWLEDTLARVPDRPTALFIHHPPFDIDDHYIGGYRHAEEVEGLAEVVSRHPQVIRLICGHVHCQTEVPWAGTTATTMPSVAVDVRKGVDETQAQERPIYMLHDLKADRRALSEAHMAA